METDRFREADSSEFLRLAAAEGWISDVWELAFLRRVFPQGCLVNRIRGFPVAFVTAIRHDRSGWIGNLLVHPELRRRGLGAELMNQAVKALEDSGVETIWLTASLSGKPLYERMGFREVDRVQRWMGTGREVIVTPCRQLTLERIREIDAEGWGDCRETMVNALFSGGNLVCGRDSFLFTRAIGPLHQIGPWSGTDAGGQALFEQVVGLSPTGNTVCLDVPSRNEVIGSFLEGCGFQLTGDTILMYQGVLPAYRPERICALASLGSMG